LLDPNLENDSTLIMKMQKFGSVYTNMQKKEFKMMKQVQKSPVTSDLGCKVNKMTVRGIRDNNYIK